MRQFINIIALMEELKYSAGMPSYTFTLEWKSTTDDHGYRSRGRQMIPVRRTRHQLVFGPFIMGGYEVDEGLNGESFGDKVKGYVVDNQAYQQTFGSADEARAVIEAHAQKKLG